MFQDIILVGISHLQARNGLHGLCDLGIPLRHSCTCVHSPHCECSFPFLFPEFDVTLGESLDFCFWTLSNERLERVPNSGNFCGAEVSEAFAVPFWGVALQVYSADVGQPGLARAAGFYQVLRVHHHCSHATHELGFFMLHREGHQGAHSFGQISLPGPENYKVSGGMWNHAVQHVLVDFCLSVQRFHNLPLHEVLIPQVTFSQHTVQHHRGRCLHLH